MHHHIIINSKFFIIVIYIYTHSRMRGCVHSRIMSFNLARLITPAAAAPSSSMAELAWFYADWCGHCSQFLPTWEELKKNPTLQGQVHFIKYDCSKSGSYPEEQTRFGVKGYPSIVLIQQDGFQKFTEGRSLPLITAFITKNCTNI